MNQRNGIRRIFLSVAVIIVAVVLFGVLLSNTNTGEKVQTVPDVNTAANARQSVNVRVGDNAASMPTNVAGANRRGTNRRQTGRKLRFRVTDVYRNPLSMAQAFLGRRTSFAAPLTAECNLTFPIERATLSVRCTGYLTQDIEIDAGEADVDLGEMQLTAKDLLRARVTNEEGEAISGAEIWVQARGNEAAELFTAGMTDGSGNLLVERGPFAYSLFAASGNQRSPWVGITPKETEVTLTIPQDANLRLLFVDKEGAPVTDLPFELRSDRSAVSWCTLTAVSNDQGRVEARLPKGVYRPFFPTFEWHPKSHNEGRIQVTADVVERTISLQRGFGISVRAMDEETGTEIPEFAAIVGSLGDKATVVSDNWSHKEVKKPFLRVPVPPVPESFQGSLGLSVKAHGYRAAYRELRHFREDKMMTVVLERAEPLRLRFLDDHGSPWPGLLVRCCYSGTTAHPPRILLRANNIGEKGYTDLEGLWELTGWENGVWSIQASLRDGSFFHVTRLALPEDGLIHDIRLPRPGWIEGDIIGVKADQRPQIIAVDAAGTRMSSWIQDGRYEIANLAPGMYWVTLAEAVHDLEYCLYWGYDVGTRVIVDPGKATVLDFDLETLDAWRLRGTITGLDEQRHWLGVVPVVEAAVSSKHPFWLRPDSLIPLAENGSFALHTGHLGARTALLCVVSEEEESGSLLLTMCEEISTREHSVVLLWAPGRLQIVDDDGLHKTTRIMRIDERLDWKEMDVPVPVNLTLAPGRYLIGIRPTGVVVDVSSGRMSRAVLGK